MMKEQHKAMFIALRDGQYDHLVDPGAAAAKPAAVAAVASAPVSNASANAGEPAGAAAPVDEAVAVAPVPSAGPPTSPDPPRPDLDLAPNTIDERKRPAPVPVPVIEAAPAPAPVSAPRRSDAPEEVPMTTRQPADARPDRELMLDLDALERAGQERSSPSLFNSQDLPPPPKNLFAAKEPGSGGVYRAVETDGHDPRRDNPHPREESMARSDPRDEPGARERPRSQPARPREDSPSPGRAATRSSPAGKPTGDARYAPARPAAIFGSTQRPQPQSLFSDELVSDKSLDEVILSYLAEDLEPPRRK
jgi:hypothetical protein